jgi:methylthioribose-1-phosphate isomerase
MIVDNVGGHLMQRGDAKDGLQDIPIEQRTSIEVTHMTGQLEDGQVRTLRIAPEGSAAENHAFDVTPAKLVTGLITERGVAEVNKASLAAMYPEKAEA